MREVVGRVAFQRRIDRAFGGLGVADLLMRECPDGLAAIVAGQIGRPARRDRGPPVARIGWVWPWRNQIVSEMRNASRSVGASSRICPQILKDSSSDPRCHASAAARCSRSRGVSVGSAGVCRRQRRIDLRPVGGVCRDQQQIGLEAMAHDETGIRGDRATGQHHGVGMEFQEMLDRAIERLHGFRAVCRECQSAFVLFHGRYLLLRSYSRLCSHHSNIRPARAGGCNLILEDGR